MSNSSVSVGAAQIKGGKGDAEHRTPSRFDHFNVFMEYGFAHLRKLGCGAAAMLWVHLWKFESKETGLTRPSLDTLARCYFGGDDAARNKGHVQRMIRQLETHGYLVEMEKGKRGRPGKSGGGRSAVYRLAVPAEKLPPTQLIEDGKVTPNATIPDGEKLRSARNKVAVGVTLQKVQKEEKTEERAPEAAEEVLPIEPEDGRGAKRKVDGTGTARKRTPEGKRESGRHPEGVHARAVAIFCEAWQRRHGRAYFFKGGQDAKHVSNVLQHLANDLTAFEGIVDRFFTHPDPWYANNGHELRHLFSALNKLQVEPVASAPRGPQDFGAMAESRIIAQVMAACAVEPEPETQPLEARVIETRPALAPIPSERFQSGRFSAEQRAALSVWDSQ